MERYYVTSYVGAMAWTLVVLLGMVGMGRLVARWCGSEAKSAGWALHAVWGMAVYILVTGILALFKLCNASVISLIVGGSAAFWLWDVRRGFAGFRLSWKSLPWGLLPAIYFVFYQFIAGVTWDTNVNPADDLVAYFTQAEKLLSTGGMDEPFSWRRLASLGGHTALQCSVLCQTSYVSAQAFEMSICPVIFLGLLTGFRDGLLRKSPAGWMICLVAATTPIIRINTASHYTGVVMLMGLFVTLDMMERGALENRRLWSLAGLIGAGFCALRGQYVPAAVGSLGLFWLVASIRNRWSLKNSAQIVAICALTAFAAMLPWMIQCFLSNETPLYPLFPGGTNPDFFPKTASVPLFEQLRIAGGLLAVPALIPLLICPVLWLSFRKASASTCVAAASLLTCAVMAYCMTLSPDDISRYAQPMLLAGAFGAIVTRLAEGPYRWLTAIASIGMLAADLPDRIAGAIDRSMALDRRRPTGDLCFSKSWILSHRKAQMLIPAGKRMLVCTRSPFLFDHSRNPIWNIDMPGGTSPRRELLFSNPPEQTKKYFASLGIEYFVFGDFVGKDNLYSKPHWQESVNSPKALWRIMAPFYLAFFDTAESFSKTETVVGREGTLNVLKFNP